MRSTRSRASDVVFQGASVAFDLSHGGDLAALSRRRVAFRSRLRDHGRSREASRRAWRRTGITVLDTVPTLLALLPRDVADPAGHHSRRRSLPAGDRQSLVPAGPPSLQHLWPDRDDRGRDGRRMLPDDPVTIGRPIPNYTCYVVDERLRSVAPGVEGELLIGGPGVAARLSGAGPSSPPRNSSPIPSGGRRRPLDARSSSLSLRRRGGRSTTMDDLLFPRPHRRSGQDPRLPRRARRDRGEARRPSMASPRLRWSCAATTGSISSLPSSCPKAGRGARSARLAQRAAASLPAYMVPSPFRDHLERCRSSPPARSTARALKLVASRRQSMRPTRRRSRAPPPRPACLRRRSGAAAAADPVRCRFLHRSWRPFAARGAVHFDCPQNPGAGAHHACRTSMPRARCARSAELLDQQMGACCSDGRPLLRAAAAAAPLPLRAGAGGRAAGHPCPCHRAMARRLRELHAAHRRGCELRRGSRLAHRRLHAASISSTVAIAIAAKWLVIGRTKPGRYPLWGVYYFRWWLAQRFIGLVHINWFQGSPFMRLYLRALGAKIGNDAMFGDVEAGRDRSDHDRRRRQRRFDGNISPMRGSRATNSSSARSKSALRPISVRPASSRTTSSSARAPSLAT